MGCGVGCVSGGLGGWGWRTDYWRECWGGRVDVGEQMLMLLMKVANLGLDICWRNSARVRGTGIDGLAARWSGGWSWVEVGIHDLGELWVSCLDPLKCLFEAQKFLLVGTWVPGEVHGAILGVPLVGDADTKVIVFGWAYNSIKNSGVEGWGWRARCGSTILLGCTCRTDGSAVVHPGKDAVVVGCHGRVGGGRC